MERFIAFEKLSKAKQRELNKRRRGTWGTVKPVTRRSQNPKAYNRKKAQQREDDFRFVEHFSFLNLLAAVVHAALTRGEGGAGRIRPEFCLMRD